MMLVVLHLALVAVALAPVLQHRRVERQLCERADLLELLHRVRNEILVSDRHHTIAESASCTVGSAHAPPPDRGRFIDRGNVPVSGQHAHGDITTVPYQVDEPRLAEM